MKFSRSFIVTLKEEPKDADVVSHTLMHRAGMIRKLGAGIYEWLPLGLRVLKKVENIVREEMNAADALELLLPTILPKELWERSGRWSLYGKELMRLMDRHEREFCLGPTHEEAITDLVAKEVKSYRSFPLTLYQFQTKFRDEIRPRFGVMRAREFLMKDAYSFDVDDAHAEATYQTMYDAYKKIFTRCGLRFSIVEADSGLIGGSFSHEFMVLADTGEELIVSCTSCGYAANLEKATACVASPKEAAEQKLIQKVSTPSVKTVEKVSAFLKIPSNHFIKSLVYNVDGALAMVLVRGDRELNEHKLVSYFKCTTCRLATEQEVLSTFNAPVGFLGPVQIPDGIRVVVDTTVKNIVNGVTGANEKDFHLVNVCAVRDFALHEVADLVTVTEGDVCARCGGALSFTRGIEVGHTFKLGTKYSESMGALFLDENGQKKPAVMGCYGIGVSRVVAAAIEQNHDANGIIWPCALAPYHVAIVPIDVNNSTVMHAADEMYHMLTDAGYAVLFDDRDERAGVKFKDMDLIGIPVRVTFGKRFAEDGMVEIKFRRTGEVAYQSKENILEYLIHEDFL